jgi:redox-sensitive bicupin YhaK (pirin superfamily)
MIRIVDTQRMPLGPNAMQALVAPVDLETAPTSVGPFAVVAHMRMEAIPPGALPVDADVRPHPHIGLAAISYAVEGAITHRDSLGNRSELVTGDLGVTIAGRGVVHSERFERLRVLGGAFEMFQLLLALPDGAEDGEPSFFRRASAEVPVVTGAGATTRWLLPAPPELPAGLPTTTPILLADVTLERGATWTVPHVPARAIYVWSGEIHVGASRVGAGQLALVEPGDAAAVADGPVRLLAFGGTNVGPRYSWWNYIHSSLERIEAAKAEWRQGRVKLPPGDTESFTPAPPDDGRPLRLLNAR